MEFVSHGEAMDLLKQQGMTCKPDAQDRVYLHLADNDSVVHLHLACPESKAKPCAHARVVRVEKSKLPGVVDHLIHKLHLPQVLLIPVGKWRRVFDAVAFSMASNEDWQEVDATATVELNTRDPLLCEPGDYHVIQDLIASILQDAESQDQGLMLTTTTAPLMVELVPDGAVRISVGNPVLADEVAQAFAQ